MAIIQLNSSTPNFSYIIRKNPESGIQIKHIRKGICFGWYSNDGLSYNIHFKDSDNSTSFGDDEFDYLNTEKYNSSLFILRAINEFFMSTVKSKDDDDIDGDDKSFIIQMIRIKHIKWLDLFNKYFDDYNIKYEYIVEKSYKLEIHTNKNFHEFLNFINVLSLFMTLLSDEYINIDNNVIGKYIQCIEKIDPPFFIKYLFNKYLLKNKNNFSKFKSVLEKTQRYDNINLSYGHTAIQRKNSIQSCIDFDRPIVDIGCGDGFYAIDFSKKLKNHQYHAIDTESEVLDRLKTKIGNKNITNIKTFTSLENYINERNDNLKSDIILTEVIEHMPKYHSNEFIKQIILNIKFNKFIITVPNKDFNKFYMLDNNEFRHPDHQWEPTYNQFVKFINFIININNFNISAEFINIGDEVNGISTSIGTIIKYK